MYNVTQWWTTQCTIISISWQYSLYEINWKYFCMLRNTFNNWKRARWHRVFWERSILVILFRLFPYSIFQLHLNSIFSFLSGQCVLCFCVWEDAKKISILPNNQQELKTRSTKNKINVNSIKGIPHTNLTLNIHK